MRLSAAVGAAAFALAISTDGGRVVVVAYAAIVAGVIVIDIDAATAAGGPTHIEIGRNGAGGVWDDGLVGIVGG